MAKIDFIDTKLSGLKLVVPFYVEDNRGFFMKSYEKQLFKMAGIETDIAETFESFSKHGVVRGLHFQPGENAQSKLVRVLSGEVFDVCVDIRPESETFGQWVGEYLNADNHKAFFIPKGFAHGFVVTSESALMSYTCSGAYNQGVESGIFYKDPDLNIEWPLEGISVIQSDKDSKLQSFKEYCASEQRENRYV